MTFEQPGQDPEFEKSIQGLDRAQFEKEESAREKMEREMLSQIEEMIKADPSFEEKLEKYIRKIEDAA